MVNASKLSKKLKTGDMIVVTWTDAGGSGGWEHYSDVPESPIFMDQPAVFLKVTNEALYIAQAIPEGQQNDPHLILAPSVIPIGCVLAVSRAKKVKL